MNEEEIEIKGLRENLLYVKDQLLEQSSLRKTVADQSKTIKELRYENKNLAYTFKQQRSSDASQPLLIKAFQDEILSLKSQIKAQETLIEQLKASEFNHVEREKQSYKEKQLTRKLNSKDLECTKLKRKIQKLTSEKQGEVDEQVESLNNLCTEKDERYNILKQKYKQLKKQVNKQSKK